MLDTTLAPAQSAPFPPPTRYGVVSPKERSTVTGLQFLQAMGQGRLPAPPIMEIMNASMVSARYGEAVIEATPDQRHLNPLGTVHGGYACTLLDSVLGCAVHSTLEIGDGYTTVELKVNFTRPIAPGMRVRAVGNVINKGRQIVTADAKLYSEDGKLLGHAVTTCIVFPVPA